MLDILIHLTHAAAAPVWLGSALALARRHEALLTGVELAWNRAPPAPDRAAAREAAARPDNALRRRGWWLEQCRNAHVAADWELLHGICPEALAKRACLADFVIGGLHVDAEEARSGMDPVLRVLFTRAAAMLLIPESFQGRLRTARIVVAWNGSAEAARALKAAAPLLQRASALLILDGERPGLPGITPPALPLRAWLRRRGIAAEWHAFPSEHDEGPTLLAAVRALHADLLVMGAWGRLRPAGAMPGGTTSWMLRHATLPLFVSG